MHLRGLAGLKALESSSELQVPRCSVCKPQLPKQRNPTPQKPVRLPDLFAQLPSDFVRALRVCQAQGCSLPKAPRTQFCLNTRPRLGLQRPKVESPVIPNMPRIKLQMADPWRSLGLRGSELPTLGYLNKNSPYLAS